MVANAKDKRDSRDPEKFYRRIKQIQRNNPGMSITNAADIANQIDQPLLKLAKNGKQYAF